MLSSGEYLTLSFVFFGLFHVTVGLRVWNLFTNKNVTNRNAELNNSNTNETRNSDTNVQTGDNSANIEIETFFISASLSNKVYLNQDDQFVFNQPCTIQVKRTLDPKYYFELMFFEFSITTLLFIGLAPSNFSSTYVPGLYDKTISLEASRGELFKDGSSLQLNSIGNLKQGDVLGISIQTFVDTKYFYIIQFAKNGVPGSTIEFTSDVYLTPTIHSTTKCCFNVNLGLTDFIYDSDLQSYQIHTESPIAPPPLDDLPAYEES